LIFIKKNIINIQSNYLKITFWLGVIVFGITFFLSIISFVIWGDIVILLVGTICSLILALIWIKCCIFINKRNK
jgi:hypothetical protein